MTVAWTFLKNPIATESSTTLTVFVINLELWNLSQEFYRVL